MKRSRASMRPLVAFVRTRLAGRPGLQRAGAGIAILALGLTTAGALVATRAETPAVEPDERAWPVSITEVAPGSRTPVLSVYGRIEAAATTRLEAPLNAPVARVLVREGERVAAGDLLLELDDAEARLLVQEQEALVAEARAQLASTRTEADLAARTAAEHEAVATLAADRLARFESLYAQRMVARELLDEVRRDAAAARIELAQRRSALEDFPHRVARAEAQLQRAEVAAARARMDLDRTRVTAPFPGPVIKVHVARGDQVMAGAPLLSLVDETSVELRVPVPARDAERLRRHLDAGRSISARVDLGGAARTLTLTRLAGAQMDGRSVVDGFFALTPDLGAAVGQVVDVRMNLPPEQDVIAVPVQALYENERIYRIENDRLVGMDVEVVGEADYAGGYRVLVRAPGLEAGQQIITTQLPRAITGLRVAPVGERVAKGKVGAEGVGVDAG